MRKYGTLKTFNSNWTGGGSKNTQKYNGKINPQLQ